MSGILLKNTKMKSLKNKIIIKKIIKKIILTYVKNQSIPN